MMACNAMPPAASGGSPTAGWPRMRYRRKHSEDCARAAVVVSPREALGDCAAMLIDRRSWRANGALALRWTGDRFELKAARPPGYEWPWARGPREPSSTA